MILLQALTTAFVCARRDLVEQLRSECKLDPFDRRVTISGFHGAILGGNVELVKSLVAGREITGPGLRPQV